MIVVEMGQSKWLFVLHIPKQTRGVSHCGLAIYIKSYVKAKRRIMETQIFHHAKI
jgi:hypothetical protein